MNQQPTKFVPLGINFISILVNDVIKLVIEVTYHDSGAFFYRKRDFKTGVDESLTRRFRATWQNDTGGIDI